MISVVELQNLQALISRHDASNTEFSPFIFPEIYDRDCLTTSLQYRREVLSNISSKLPSRSYVIDIGCANGTDLLLLHQLRPDLHLYGCDISATAIALAQACSTLLKRTNSHSPSFHLISEVDVDLSPFQYILTNGIFETRHNIAARLSQWRELQRFRGTAIIQLARINRDEVWSSEDLSAEYLQLSQEAEFPIDTSTIPQYITVDLK